LLGRISPDLHAAIDHDVDAGHIGALVARKEQCDVRHLLRLPARKPSAALSAPSLVLANGGNDTWLAW
jgi:hypothetical protein